MVALYRDPDGENIKATAIVTGSSNTYTVTTRHEHNLEGLRQRIRELEASLKQCGNEVFHLQNKVRRSICLQAHYVHSKGLDIIGLAHNMV